MLAFSGEVKRSYLVVVWSAAVGAGSYQEAGYANSNVDEVVWDLIACYLQSTLLFVIPHVHKIRHALPVW